MNEQVETAESSTGNQTVPAISMEVKSGITYPPGSVWMGRGSKYGSDQVVPKVRKATVRHRRACVICEKTFLAARSDANFCSPRCRMRGNRQGVGFRGQEGSRLSQLTKIDHR